MTSAANPPSSETWPSAGGSYERTVPTTSRFGTDESGASEPQSLWPDSRYTWMPTEGSVGLASRSESGRSNPEPSFDLSLMGQRLPTPPPPNTMGPTPLPARVKSGTGVEECESRSKETSAQLTVSRLESSLLMKSSFKQRALDRIAEQTREADEMELKLSQISLQPRSASSVLSPTNYSQYIAENDQYRFADESALRGEEEEELIPVDSHRSRISMGYEVDHLEEDENDQPLINSLGFMSLSKSRNNHDSPLSSWTVSRDTERVTLQRSNSADRMISCWEFSDATSYRPQTDRMDFSATPPRTLPPDQST